MRLFELFSDQGTVKKLRSYLLDILMPIAAQGVPYVLVDTLIEKLQEMRVGLEIDRALIFQVLSPKTVKMITKIEGDKIYFQIPETVDRSVSDDEEKREKEKLSKTASAQAKKEVKK